MADSSKDAQKTPQGPNRRIYRIPAPLLLASLRQMLQVPPDVQMISFWPDHRVDPEYFTESDRVLYVSLEHPSFDPVAWKVPEIDLVEKKKPVRIEVQVKKAGAA